METNTLITATNALNGKILPLVDPNLAIWGIACLFCIAAIGTIGFTIVAVTAYRRDPRSTSGMFFRILQGGNALRILTAFWVVMAAVLLGLAGKLTEGAVTLLGSIAGYVLGGLRQTEPKDDADKDKHAA
jgi:hypothetical protein